MRPPPKYTAPEFLKALRVLDTKLRLGIFLNVPTATTMHSRLRAANLWLKL